MYSEWASQTELFTLSSFITSRNQRDFSFLIFPALCTHRTLPAPPQPAISNMADWIFFRDSWIHEYVDFEQPYPSRWKVIELISEHSHQPAVQADMQELENSPPSYSEATFLCRNARDPAQEAFLRVYMQIPHLGTEDASHSIRSAQAGFRTHDDIEAMKLFRDNRARYVPWCLGVKDIKQDNFGLVPGGYMSYLLWEKLPGVHLDMETFWSLDRAERDAIREAFEPAYK